LVETVLLNPEWGWNQPAYTMLTLMPYGEQKMSSVAMRGLINPQYTSVMLMTVFGQNGLLYFSLSIG